MPTFLYEYPHEKCFIFQKIPQKKFFAFKFMMTRPAFLLQPQQQTNWQIEQRKHSLNYKERPYLATPELQLILVH